MRVIYTFYKVSRMAYTTKNILCTMNIRTCNFTIVNLITFLFINYKNTVGHKVGITYILNYYYPPKWLHN